MPPRGAKRGTKRARRHEHAKERERKRGRSPSRAKEIAANEERTRSEGSRANSPPSRHDISSSRRGGRAVDVRKR
jgi:hypothetical protein